MYPIRARFPNVLSGTTGWVTVGYIPYLKPRHGASDAEKIKLRIKRNGLLQRCLAVLLDRFIVASRDGEHVTLRDLGDYTVFPRIVLYVADQPEERHVVGLLLNQCSKMCTPCMAAKNEVGSPGLEPQERDVLATLELQLEAAALMAAGTGAGRLQQISADHSASPFVPILGAVHGLGTGTLALYKVFGFDLLHVCWRRVLPALRRVCPICGLPLAPQL